MKRLHKILSSTQTRACDQYTILSEPISSLELMERASVAFADEVEKRLQTDQIIGIICGPGNNGGDGLAVARILRWRGFETIPILIEIGNSLSEDCTTNLTRLDDVIRVRSASEIPDLSNCDIIIDALFGSGLSRPIEGWVGDVVDAINDSKVDTISIDIPSGLYCDFLPMGPHIVEADLVVSFQRPKLSFFIKEASRYIGEWKVVDIGLDEDFIQGQDSRHFVLDDRVAALVKRREKYSHKGTYGHALMVAGSRGKMGAAILAGRACLRAGVGLLTMHTPGCGLNILQVAVPEAMCVVDVHDYHVTEIRNHFEYRCIGIGPGIGQSKETRNALIHLLNSTQIPLVIDADALNIISGDSTLAALIPEDCILTPHPKEFQRLAGDWGNSLERLQLQIDFSIRHRCIVVLKDADTVITDQKGRVYFNTTGNPGMATGGSGDVLTGVITSLRAQGYSPLEAALLGVYFHGKAGDKAKENQGETGLIAGDLVRHLKMEWKE